MISRLYIKNFRSIGSDGLIIDFSTNLSALVGKNNVGKSNILVAIDYLLGGYWINESRFRLEDFYQKNVENDIGICALFTEPLLHIEKIDGWFEHKQKVHGFKLTYKTYKRDSGEHKKGDLHLDYTCVNAKGEDIRLPTIAPKKGNTEEYKSSFTKILKVNRKLKEQVEVVYIPVNRDILKFSPSSSKSLLGTLIKGIRERFKHDNYKYEMSKEFAEFLGVNENASRDEMFEAYMTKANETLKTEELVQLSDRLAKYVQEHLGAKRTKELKFDFKVQDEWAQFKFLDLTILDNEVNIPVQNLGNGFQSLIVISIFRTYLELKDKHPIFLIEEPEMFLHTHAKKYFYSVLNQLGEKGNQIIYTTHATEFVDILNSESVKRVITESSSTKILPPKPIELDFKQDDLLKLNTAINNERAELFFAEKVILVEGETEKIVFDYLLKLKGINPNLNDISIIETSGKGNMPRYIKLLESIEIPFVVVFDTDILDLTGDVDRDKKINENNTDAMQKNQNIENSISSKDLLFPNSPYFEVEAGMTLNLNNKKDSKPLKAIEYFNRIGDYSAIMKSLPNIIAPLEKILD
jgi:putative ATP-dependent endonuclease of the OLD family